MIGLILKGILLSFIVLVMALEFRIAAPDNKFSNNVLSAAEEVSFYDEVVYYYFKIRTNIVDKYNNIQ